MCIVYAKEKIKRSIPNAINISFGCCHDWRRAKGIRNKAKNLISRGGIWQEFHCIIRPCRNLPLLAIDIPSLDGYDELPDHQDTRNAIIV